MDIFAAFINIATRTKEGADELGINFCVRLVKHRKIYMKKEIIYQLEIVLSIKKFSVMFHKRRNAFSGFFFPCDKLICCNCILR